MSSAILQWHTVLCLVMESKVDALLIKETDVGIRLFLSMFAEIDKKLRQTGTRPRWITSYNYLCLLNIPNNMRDFGPMRGVWEGGLQGEGILRFIKSDITMGLRKNWQVSILERFLKRKSMAQILHRLSESDIPSLVDDDTDDTEDISRSSYHRYKNTTDAIDDFYSGKPMSVVLKEDGMLGCMIGFSSFLEVNRIGFCKNISGMDYHRWEILNKDTTEARLEEDILTIKTSMLLLPELGEEGLETGLSHNDRSHTLIDWEWNQIDSEGRMVKPLFREYDPKMKEGVGARLKRKLVN